MSSLAQSYMAKSFAQISIVLVYNLSQSKKFSQFSYGALNLETSFIAYSILMEKGINAAANDDDQVDSTKYRVGVQWEPVKKNQYSVSIQLEPIKKKIGEFSSEALDLDILHSLLHLDGKRHKYCC